MLSSKAQLHVFMQLYEQVPSYCYGTGLEAGWVIEMKA